MDNKSKIVQMLLDAGADVNSPDSKGRMPLHYAIALNDLPLVDLLLNFGADMLASDKNGFTPWDYADIETKLLYEKVLTITPQNSVQLLERLAVDTWERLKSGIELKCLQGEETITDINLLEILRASLPDIYVCKTLKKEESESGVDWEMWIGSNSTHWWRYAVQAKRIDSTKSRYNQLRHKVGGKFQFTILEEYSNKNNCIPLYCFYNFLDTENLESFWRCNLPFEEKQFGCTIAPLDSIRKAFSPKEAKTFQWIHRQGKTIPWRCLVCCPSIVNTRVNPLSSKTSNIRPWAKLPTFLERSDSQISLDGDIQRDFYRLEGGYPKFIVVINNQNSKLLEGFSCTFSSTTPS